MTKDDPLVTQVRAERRAMLRQCGDDHRKLYELVKQVEVKHKNRVVKFDASKRP